MSQVDGVPLVREGEGVSTVPVREAVSQVDGVPLVREGEGEGVSQYCTCKGSSEPSRQCLFHEGR